MDKIEKILRSLLPQEKKKILSIVTKIKSRSIKGLDVLKLSGRDDVYRVRSGKYRIIFQNINSDEIMILAIEKRSDTTYNF
ncbi:hypothetical protein IT409_01405 [Candidatus Falkowbacteria bacterium]|nr:hypothetical protein [Candidatus Falkowbacteria bacterium]